MALDPNSPSFNLDFYLKKQATEWVQDSEVDRILQCSPLDPFQILELDVYSKSLAENQLKFEDRFPQEKDIKAAYRKKSLLLHPDKCKHPETSKAFDVLKKAEQQLSDLEKRRDLLVVLDEATREAQRTVANNSNVRPPAGTSNPSLNTLVRSRFLRMLSSSQSRSASLLASNLERERKQKEEVENELKRKRQYDKEWEETREKRVGSWRDFQKKGKGAGGLKKLKT
ncbi:hypothetical protein M427DRAFT_52168 [Gonapodya prolifera JEL478]|uniref:J domain-containing protein n=1 Tax=Gonapodya prolifera (strain JEL478) TaxID=1344416 RepID=A0A139AVF9_GONPJ|nr:hypothetical protein M427DRAFT_52168 [Gonapodya prolifera JEL478]|eukprot:KXS20573.1 hypothetical protein M427DRAFT_52168 [Gonapodya prolifera JEL478]